MMSPYHLRRVSPFLFLCSMTVNADTDAMPRLKMVVFDEPARVSSTDNRPDRVPMQMVVFSEPPHNNAELNGNTGVADVGQGRKQTTSVSRQAQELPELRITFFVEGGYRHDDLDWSIAAPTGNPNVLSELQWQNVQSATVESGVNIDYANNWHAEAKLGYGAIVDGLNQDSDYYLNDRQGEFSRSNNVTDDGASFDVSGAFGYHLNIGDPKRTPSLRFTPKIGYAYHSQQFNMTHGYQTIPAFGNFGGLDSTYDATWFGPWGGLDSRFVFNTRLSLESSIEYHFADYEGAGNWNLRPDFQHPKSFTHTAEGEGIVAKAMTRYLIAPDWTLRLSANYQEWRARHKGVDTTYFSDGSVGETRFNGVYWNSYGVNLGVDYTF